MNLTGDNKGRGEKNDEKNQGAECFQDFVNLNILQNTTALLKAERREVRGKKMKLWRGKKHPRGKNGKSCSIKLLYISPS